MSEDEVLFRSWFQAQLSDLLGFPTGEEMINYILAFESAREIKEHFSGLLDPQDPATHEFTREFFARWKPQTLDDRAYKKDDVEKVCVLTSGKAKKSENHCSAQLSSDPQSVENGCQPMKPMGMLFPDEHQGCEEMPNPPQSNETDNSLISGKAGSPFKAKHLNFVPLYCSEGKVRTEIVLLDGRHPCKCLAQKHKLINNCGQCGRVVCEQEGAGPCMFCNNLVCSREDQEILSRESNSSKKLIKKLMAQTYEEVQVSVDASLEKAVAHKDRLLEFDKNCIKRTKVVDDEADYYSDHRWLTKKKREELAKREQDIREKENVSRLDRKFTIDFFGRKIIEEVSVGSELYEPVEDDAQVVPNSSKSGNVDTDLSRDNPLIDPRLKVSPPRYEISNLDHREENFKAGGCPKDSKQFPSLRVQDGGLQQISDAGICLSMHQPWASLLVYGIKKLEGRSWYTPHRGRLWIASTAKMPQNDQIRNIENKYRCLYPHSDIVFPESYPSGALLGCVNLVDCVTNEEYFQKNPDVLEENDSAYLFVCENPEHLEIKFAIEGQHKTYKLAKYVHDAAKLNLLSSRSF